MTKAIDHDTRTPVPTRELLAMLVTLGGADLQVRAHVTANLNVRNTRGTLLSVITALLPFNAPAAKEHPPYHL